MFDNLDSHIDSLKEVVSNVDFLVDLRTLFLEEIETRSGAIANLWSLLRIKDSQLLQRSTCKWLKEGDNNSGYFHEYVKVEANEIRKKFVKHFYDIFRETNVDRPHLNCVVFRYLGI